MNPTTEVGLVVKETAYQWDAGIQLLDRAVTRKLPDTSL
jgi:hypothetical protein